MASEEIVRTTEYLACPAQFRYKQSLPQDQWAVEHYWNILGRAAHSMFFAIIKQELVDFKKFAKEAFDYGQPCSWRVEERVIEILPMIEAQFRQWLAATKLDLDNLTIEQEFTIRFHGIDQVGHPDAYNNTILLDFKTGPQYQKKWEQQIADYNYALAHTDGKERDCYIIMVRFDKWQERKVDPEKLSKAFDRNHDRMRWWLREIKKEYPTTEVTPLCAACLARHVCPGI